MHLITDTSLFKYHWVKIMLKKTWTAISNAFSGEVGAIPLEELKLRYGYPD